MTAWMEKKDLNFFSQRRNQGTLWILNTTSVLPLLVMDNQTSYGVVLKVWIEMFNCIPSTIELVAKTPKTYDHHEVCKQCLEETPRLAPCEHPNFIKFLTIHSKTMEFTHCGEMGAWFEKCCITTWNIRPLWRINCYCKKGGLVWKGEDNLSPLGKIVWR